MSKELDGLLSKMNEVQARRQFSDIPLRDPYWDARDAYNKALHLADGVHVPEKKDPNWIVKNTPLHRMVGDGFPEAKFEHKIVPNTPLARMTGNISKTETPKSAEVSKNAKEQLASVGIH